MGRLLSEVTSLRARYVLEGSLPLFPTCAMGGWTRCFVRTLVGLFCDKVTLTEVEVEAMKEEGGRVPLAGPQMPGWGL